MANRYGPLPGSRKHLRTLPEDLSQPPDTVLRSGEAARPLPTTYLSPPHIRAFKARKIESGLNPNTVGVMQGVLSAALNQAVDDGLIFQNPASRVKKAATRGETPMRL